MSSWDKNPYYNPEALGLRKVAEYDRYAPDYSFDIALVVADSEGKLWIADDSGCSCPTPFEDHVFPRDFEPVEKAEKVLEYQGDQPILDFFNSVRNWMALNPPKKN